MSPLLSPVFTNDFGNRGGGGVLLDEDGTNVCHCCFRYFLDIRQGRRGPLISMVLRFLTCERLLANPLVTANLHAETASEKDHPRPFSVAGHGSAEKDHAPASVQSFWLRQLG